MRALPSILIALLMLSGCTFEQSVRSDLDAEVGALEATAIAARGGPDVSMTPTAKPTSAIRTAPAAAATVPASETAPGVPGVARRNSGRVLGAPPTSVPTSVPRVSASAAASEAAYIWPAQIDRICGSMV